MKIKNKLNFNSIIEGILVFVMAYMIFRLCQRSIWLDEAYLLKSILNSDNYLSFFTPLPYYDQAQPVIASFIFKGIVDLISKHFFYIRLIYFLLLSSSFIAIYKIFSLNIKKENRILTFLIAGASLSVWGFYFTEIKHYGLEIVASFAIVGTIYFYHKTEDEIKTLIFLLLILPLGFSTLIPIGLVFGCLFLIVLYKKKNFSKEYILFSLILLLEMLLIYLHMKYLTIYQLNNYQVYFSKGWLSDIKELIDSIFGAYGGRAFFLIAASSTLISFLSDKKSFLFKLNIYFIITSFSIVILKILGVYPVISGRHIVWIVPFSLVIINLTLIFLKEQKNIFSKVIFYFLISLLSIVFFKNINRKMVFTNNNDLYSFVSKMEKSNILVLQWAVPSLEYYSSEVYPELKIHNYFYNDFSLSEKREIDVNIFLNRFKSNIGLISIDEFYLLNSHLASVLDDKEDERIDTLKEYLKENNYRYEVIFTSDNVELLKIFNMNSMPKK